MTSASSHSLGMVVSGLPYPVTDIAGRPPQSLADFVTATDFTIDMEHQPYVVHGSGMEREECVRFYEKGADDEGGKDVRVWQITATAEGGFLAEHAAAF